MQEKPRYYLIACGTSNYNDQNVPNLESVPTDLQKVINLFTQQFGYEKILTNIPLNPQKDDLIKQFSDWLQNEERHESDRVIFYYSGHGEYVQGDRHYLLMEDTLFSQLPQTSLPTEDLVRPLKNEGVKIEQILYIIDTCYSSVGTGDVTKLASEAIQKYQPVGGASIAVHAIAACRAKDTAQEGVFSKGLQNVLEDLSQNSTSLDYICLNALVDKINQIISLYQRASYSTSGSEISAKFFPIIPKTIRTWEEKQDEFVSQLFSEFKKYHKKSLFLVNSFIFISKNTEKFLLEENFISSIEEIKEILKNLGQRPVSRGICPLIACAEWCCQQMSKADSKLYNPTFASNIKRWQQEVIKYRKDANLFEIKQYIKNAELKFQELIKQENLRLQVEIEPEVDNDSGTGQTSGALLLSMNLWLESQDLPLGRFAEKIRLESDKLYDNLEKILPKLIHEARYSLLERIDLTIEYFIPFDYFQTPLEKIKFKRGRKQTPLCEEYPVFINSYERYFDEDFREIRDDIKLKKQALWDDANHSVNEPCVPGEFEADDIYYMGTDPSDYDLERIEDALPIAVWSRNINQPLIEGDHLKLSEWKDWLNKILKLRKTRKDLEVTLFWDDLYPKPSKRCRPLNTDVVN